MTVLNSKCCKELETKKYLKLNQLVNLNNLDVKVEEEDLKLIKKYYTTCFQNSKHVQNVNSDANRKLVLKHSGTNKGQTRQPYALISGQKVVASGPSTRKGGRALKINLNNSKKKMNRKEKRTALVLLLKKIIKESQLFLVSQTSNIQKKVFFKTIKDEDNVRLKKCLEKKQKIVLFIQNDNEFMKLFRNFPSIKFNKDKKDYYSLISGFNFKKVVFFTKKGLQEVLNQIT